MTLNQARDTLVAEFPGRTIYVNATCKHSQYTKRADKNYTEFSATVWRKELGSIECQTRCHVSLQDVLQDVRAHLREQADDEVLVAEESEEC